jgi:hypothetical protein
MCLSPFIRMAEYTSASTDAFPNMQRQNCRPSQMKAYNKCGSRRMASLTPTSNPLMRACRHVHGTCPVVYLQDPS